MSIGGTVPTAPGDVGPVGRARPPIPAVLGAYAVVGLVTTAVAMIGAAHRRPTLPPVATWDWIGAWLTGDAGWYQTIAASGYSYTPGQQSSIAFFPTYPMTVRAVGWVFGGDVRLAGWLVAVAAGAGAVVAFTCWVWSRLPRSAAITAVALLMLYPYSFFLYGAMFSDSTFLVLAVGAFLLVERRMFVLAGFVGALATAGRPVGVAVAIGLVVRVIELRAEARRDLSSRPVTAAVSDRAGSDRWWPARPGLRDLLRAVPDLRWRDAGVLVAGFGLAAWCIYLWTTFGDPLAFSTVQAAPGWNQGGGPRTWLKFDYFGTLLYRSPDLSVRLTAQALMLLLALLLLRRVWRLFGWGYLAYALVVLAIPLIGTKDFMGTGRYVLAAFPAIAAGAHVLATTRWRWIRPVLLTLFAAGLLVATYFHSIGEPVT